MNFIRLAGAPNKCEFLGNGLNIIDVLAILPYFVEISMDIDTKHVPLLNKYQPPIYAVFNETSVDSGLFDEEEDNLQGVLQVFRVFKLARILKLAR